MPKYIPVKCTWRDKWNEIVIVSLLHVHWMHTHYNVLHVHWMHTLYTFIQVQVHCMIINQKLHYNNNNG